MTAGKHEAPESASTAPRCSVIIRAYNEEQHIGRLLSGILAQNWDAQNWDAQQWDAHEMEVIIVDSGSTDATLEIAAAYADRLPLQVVHIRPEEFTFGRSLNLGIEHARGELIVIASAHVYPVYPDWLERLLAPFSDPRVALAYGRQRGGASSKFSEHQIFAHWFPATSQMHQPHPFCNNANAAIRRSLWEQHSYDESLTGLEDLEWANWAQNAGHAIAYVAEAEIIHLHNETPRAVYNRYRREAMAFKRIFPHERFSLLDLLRLTPSNIVSDLWHAARDEARFCSAGHSFWSCAGDILWFRCMQFWGTYVGYRQSGPVTNQLRQTFYYPRASRSDLTRRSDTDSKPPASRPLPPIHYPDQSH